MTTGGLILNCLMAALKEPIITDWLMVIITIIYVVATIVISKANKDALKASEKLVDASIAQVNTLKEQIKTSTNLQLFESRVNVLKKLEQMTGFGEHESLLDILFTEEIVNKEKEIISLCNQRNQVLNYYSVISHSLGYMAYCEESLPKLKGAYVSKSEINGFIDKFEGKSSRVTISANPISNPDESKTIREKAVGYTDDIAKNIEEFFVIAKLFIKQTIE